MQKRGSSLCSRESQCSSQVETGMSENFLSCSQGVKNPFEIQQGRFDFPQGTWVEKGLISLGGENFLDNLELRQVPLELRWGPQGPTRVASRKASLHASCKGPLRIPLQSVPSIDSHHGGTCESHSGKPRGKATDPCVNEMGSLTLLLQLRIKADVQVSN